MNALRAFLFLTLFALPVSVHAEDQPTTLDDMPGIEAGEGSFFEVDDSDYLDVSVESTEEIELRLESIPSMILLRLKPVEGTATSTMLTLSGLKPSTTYYKYQDNLHNLELLVSDEHGVATYTQDLSDTHRAFIQPRKSTKFIKDDATGGDCVSFGTWDAPAKTCTLTTDLTETVQIDSDGITLDGAGHAIRGLGSGTGVFFENKDDVTLRNLAISKWTFGVLAIESAHFTLASSTIASTTQAVVLDTIYTSTVADNAFRVDVPGFRDQGVVAYDSMENRIEGNTIVLHDDVTKLFGQQGVLLFDSHRNVVTDNLISETYQGLLLFDSNDNQIFHNNFVRNGVPASMPAPFGIDTLRGAHIRNYDGVGNVFERPLPEGGNYFDTFDESSENCVDADTDGVCDAPYMFIDGQDALPWTTPDGWENPPDPCAEPGSCASNVLFLPGIQGSRLYEGTGCGGAEEEKLWEPFDSVFGAIRGKGDDKMRKLFLDDAGGSVCEDIYAKKDGVLDAVGGAGFYQALIDQMDGLVAEGTINDWEPLAYDWRLSLDDLLTNGREEGGKIFYTKATTTPYIEQTLRALSAGSKSGKVSIIAHSNGGLLAKALLKALGEEAASLVDQVIMVGAPQTGAPEAIGVTLLGHNAGIYQYRVPVVSNAAARAFAQNSPMAYHLLPSGAYLESVKDDAAHPLARFAGEAYAPELGFYGSTVDTFSEFTDFLLAKNGEREDPEEGNLYDAEILKAPLMSYAERTHTDLDAWVPPEEIEVHQIAGWGVDTVAGIDFYTQQSSLAAGPLATQPTRKYRPLFVEDGDGTVPIPSALAIASSTNVKRYWLDLEKINNLPDNNTKYKHPNIFGAEYLRSLIGKILKNENSLPEFVLSTQPQTTDQSRKLIFYLHSPLTLQLSDSSGNTTGLSVGGEVTQEIPGATYGEFGEVKYIIAPEGAYTLALQGLDSGTFSLDIQESSGGEITTTTTIADVPATANTKASMTISGGAETASALSIDEDGDGEEDISVQPQIGQTVLYVAEESVSVEASSSGGRSSSRRKRSSTVATTTPSVAATTMLALPVIAMVVPQVLPATIETPVRSLIAIDQLDPEPSPTEQSPQVSKTMSQTASVYDAISQQGLFSKIGAAVYNGLHTLWTALLNLF